MIGVCGVAEVPGERVRVDHYIPLIIELGTAWGQNVYWRSGHFPLSLQELGIQRESGRVSSFTLTLVGPALQVGEWVDLTTLPSSAGAPIIDLDGWPRESSDAELAYQVTDDEPFVVRLSTDAVSVAFGDLHRAERTLSTGRCHFVVGAEHELMGVEVRGLTAFEMQAVCRTLARPARDGVIELQSADAGVRRHRGSSV